MKALKFTCILITAAITGMLIPLGASGFPGEAWQLYKETNGIQIYIHTEECHDFKNGTHYEYLVFKFVNTTGSTKTISWSEDLYYNNVQTASQNSDHPLKQIRLNAQETKQGGCGIDSGDTFRVFSRFLNYPDLPALTHFDLINIIVTDT